MSVKHGNWDGSRKVLGAYPEVFDGNGPGNDFSVPYPKLRARVGSDELFFVNKEIIGGGESSQHLDSDPEFIDGNNIISSEHLTSYPDDDNDDALDGDFDLFVPRAKLSSSSSSSLDDSFQLDAVGSFNPRAIVPGGHTQTALMDNSNAVSGNNPQELKERVGDLQLQTLAFPVSDVIHESLIGIIPQTRSPPIQIMQRIEPYDPLRIPTSIFDPDNPTTHVDWSNASNESLFSIHLGNNSFNRDHVVSMGERLKPAEELFKSDELLIFSPSLPIPVTPTDNQSSVPPKEHNKEIIISENIREAKSKSLDDSSRMPANAEWEDKKSATPAPHKSASISKSSGESGDSRRSFSFPVKKKCLWYSCHSCKCNCAWPSCHCCTFPSCSCAWLSCRCCKSRRARPSCYSSNCSWAFCYCKRPSCKGPSCNFRWLRCSSCCNYSWAFCCSWNCSCKGWCCHSSTVLGEGMKSTSGKGNVKVEQELESSPSSVKSKPKKSWCHWLSCFSCCSWGSCCSGSSCRSWGSCCSCGRSCCSQHSCFSWGSCCSCGSSCCSQHSCFSWGSSCCSQHSCFSWGSCCSWTSCSSCRCACPRCHCC